MTSAATRAGRGRPGTPRHNRAAPMSPEQRRASIVAATLPLMLEHGPDVNTRQIAAAAQVAEGTIFRAFGDKQSLIAATMHAAMDPAPLFAELDKIDMSKPLRHRMLIITRIMQERMTSIVKLMLAVRMKSSLMPEQSHVDHKAAMSPKTREEINGAITDALARLLEPDRAALRYPPKQVAQLWRQFIFTTSHPLIADGSVESPEQVVSLLLDGVTTRECDCKHHCAPTKTRTP